MTDSDLMPWGKYKGNRMIDVPASYLLWLWDNDKAGDSSVYDYIADNLDVLMKQKNEENDG